MSLRILTLAAPVLAFALAQPALAKDHPSHGHGEHASPDHAGHHGAEHGVRLKACPPGLAKKHNGCLPPGQWRKGDRLPDDWVAQFIVYAALPEFYRDRYDQDRRYRYLYRDNRVFVVDAVTHVILDVILR